jgi:hypothetical protein
MNAKNKCECGSASVRVASGHLLCSPASFRSDDQLAGIASDRATISMVCFFHWQLSFDKGFQFPGIEKLA